MDFKILGLKLMAFYVFGVHYIWFLRNAGHVFFKTLFINVLKMEDLRNTGHLCEILDTFKGVFLGFVVFNFWKQ